MPELSSSFIQSFLRHFADALKLGLKPGVPGRHYSRKESCSDDFEHRSKSEYILSGATVGASSSGDALGTKDNVVDAILDVFYLNACSFDEPLPIDFIAKELGCRIETAKKLCRPYVSELEQRGVSISGL